MWKRWTALMVFLLFSLTTVMAAASAPTRIKDVAKVQGVRSNQLVGYGLVTGLNGTGDGNKSLETIQSIVAILAKYGIWVDSKKLQSKNVAAVMVTAQLPPFVKPGDTIDITVSSMGDAKSLQGGVLLQTPLKAANGNVYAVGQGPLSIGGYMAGNGGNTQVKSIPTVGLLPNGAIVEREVPTDFVKDNKIVLALSRPDFTTASSMVQAVNNRFGFIAQARDAGTVVLNIPYEYNNNAVNFISDVENLLVYPDTPAKIVINERTGTIVIGSNVTIDEVGIAQGGLAITIKSNKDVSQPPPLSNGTTVTTTNTTVTVDEPKANVLSLPASASVSDVVSALNAVGATANNIIAILQAMKAAGALHADIEVI